MEIQGKKVRIIKVMYKYWDHEKKQEPFMLLFTTLSAKEVELLYESYERKGWESFDSFVDFIKDRKPTEIIEEYEGIESEFAKV